MRKIFEAWKKKLTQSKLTSWKTSYKQSKFSTRIITWLILMSVMAALTYNFQWDYIVTLIGTASILISIEIFVFRPYFLSAGAITLLFWIMFVIFMSFLTESFSYYYTPNQMTYMELSMYAGTLLGTILIIFSNWYIANGRYWVNLLASYTLYLTALIFLPVISINPIYVPIVALLPVAIWVTIRRFLMYRKEYTFNIEDLPQKSNDTAATKKLEKRFPNATIMKEDRVTIIYNNKNVYLILPITANKTLEISNKGILLDNQDITYTMSHITNKLNIISKAAKIKGTKLFPIIYITNNKMDRGITPVTYKSRRKPDISEGTVFFINNKDFPRFTKEMTLSAPTMTKKEQQRYEKLFKKTQQTKTLPEPSNNSTNSETE